jgi:hypothetical protein
MTAMTTKHRQELTEQDRPANRYRLVDSAIQFFSPSGFVAHV